MVIHIWSTDDLKKSLDQEPYSIQVTNRLHMWVSWGLLSETSLPARFKCALSCHTGRSPPALPRTYLFLKQYGTPFMLSSLPRPAFTIVGEKPWLYILTDDFIFWKCRQPQCYLCLQTSECYCEGIHARSSEQTGVWVPEWFLEPPDTGLGGNTALLLGNGFIISDASSLQCKGSPVQPLFWIQLSGPPLNFFVFV